MQQTSHYGLQKPDPNDTYNKATDNSNMDAIDAQMYANAQAAAAAQKNITQAAAAPANPVAGDLWLDTSSAPNILKRYDGTEWVTVGTVLPSDLAKTDVAQTWTATQTFAGITATSASVGGNDILTTASNIGASQLPAATTDAIGAIQAPQISSASTNPRAPIVVANVGETNINSNSEVGLMAFTPTAQGNFEVRVYVRNPTSNQNVYLHYTDENGPEQLIMTPDNSSTFNTQTSSGTAKLYSAVVNATTSGPILVGIQSYGSVYASGTITALGTANYTQAATVSASGGNSWAQGTAPPRTSEYPAAGYSPTDKLTYMLMGSYTVSSEGSTGNSGGFNAFSTSTNAWTSEANCPNTSNEIGGGVMTGSNLFYVWGGASTYSYAHSNNAWTSHAAMPVSQSAIGYDVDNQNNYLYAFNSYNSSTGSENQSYRYSASSNAWTALATDPNAAWFSGTACDTDQNLVYVVDAANHHSYSASSNSYSALANDTVPRNYDPHDMYVSNQSLTYRVDGALVSNGNPSNALNAYSYSSNSWTSYQNDLASGDDNANSYNSDTGQLYSLNPGDSKSMTVYTLPFSITVSTAAQTA